MRMPTTKPTRATTAFRSPPAIRRAMRRGQPRKIRAPTITPKPRTKRVRGEEPPRGAKSFLMRAIRKAPHTRPMISGRTYCTMAAPCIPTPPAMSRMKQAMQKPMFLGLPSITSTTAITPTRPPPMSRFLFSFMSLSSYTAILQRMGTTLTIAQIGPVVKQIISIGKGWIEKQNK